VTTTRTTHTSTHGTSNRTTSARSTAGAAAGPAFVDAQSSDLGVQLVARGPQDTSVRTGQDAHGRFVTVAVGRTLVYTYDIDIDIDIDTITVHVAGWRHAHTRACRVFADHYRAPLPHQEAGGIRSAGAAVLHVAGQFRPVVTAGRPPAGPAPFVTVATGRLTTVCLAAAAVAALWPPGPFSAPVKPRNMTGRCQGPPAVRSEGARWTRWIRRLESCGADGGSTRGRHVGAPCSRAAVPHRLRTAGWPAVRAPCVPVLASSPSTVGSPGRRGLAGRRRCGVLLGLSGAVLVELVFSYRRPHGQGPTVVPRPPSGSDGGLSGVREPRRPRPTSGAGLVEARRRSRRARR